MSLRVAPSSAAAPGGRTCSACSSRARAPTSSPSPTPARPASPSPPRWRREAGDPRPLSLDDAIACGVDAALIAAPPHAHAGLVLRALAAGLDVFVEKPLALRAADAERCAARAAALGRVAMVGHLLRYHPTVERLLQLAREGALGRLLGMESARLSVAVRPGWHLARRPRAPVGRRHLAGAPERPAPSDDEPQPRAASALWMLGPHDLSVLHALDPSPIRALSARTGPGGDPVGVEAELASGFAFSAALSRAAPVKERRIRVVGSAATAVFDDVRAPDRLLVGGVEIAVAWQEPLAVEIDHFLRCVEHRAEPRTPLEHGVTVVRALAQCLSSCRGLAPRTLVAT